MFTQSELPELPSTPGRPATLTSQVIVAHADIMSEQDGVGPRTNPYALVLFTGDRICAELSLRE